METFKELLKGFWIFKPDPMLGNNLMAFGIECGPGWFKLIYELCVKLDEVIREKYPEMVDTFEVVQVKEKFGTLRFYVSSGNEEIYNIIDEYEHKSATICEMCGNIGHLNSRHGWYSTLCDDCWKEVDERHGRQG